MEEKGKVYGSATVLLCDGAARAKSCGWESWRAGQLTQSHRQLKLCTIEDSNGDVLSSVDHISPKTWKGDVSLESVVLLTAWNEGRQLIKTKFASLGVSSHFAKMEKAGVDLLYPSG